MPNVSRLKDMSRISGELLSIRHNRQGEDTMEIDFQAKYLARIVADEKRRDAKRAQIQLEHTPKIGDLLKNLTELFR
jgi:outer membrane protein assembly factor BamE (lipoprotein component of BamABCDE complex)